MNTTRSRRSQLHMLGIRITRSPKGQRMRSGWYAVRRDIDNPSDTRERRGPYPDMETAIKRGEQLASYPASVTRHLDKTEYGFKHNPQSREAQKTRECAVYRHSALLTDEDTGVPPLESTLLTA